MNAFLPYGAILASLSFLLYTAVIYLEFKKRVVTPLVLGLLLPAFVFNLVAVVLMFAKTNGCSAHSILGYVSLIVISLNTMMTVRFYVKNGRYTKMPIKTRLYASVAYALWLSAFITGSILGLVR